MKTRGARRKHRPATTLRALLYFISFGSGSRYYWYCRRAAFWRDNDDDTEPDLGFSSLPAALLPGIMITAFAVRGDQTLCPPCWRLFRHNGSSVMRHAANAGTACV